MPELRWTLLLLGALFIAVLAWSERRKARQSTRTGHEPSIPDVPVVRPPREPTIREPTLREPALTLPEVRARDPSPPQDLPVVHVEDESLIGLRLDGRRDPGERSPPEPVAADAEAFGRMDAHWDAPPPADPSIPDLPVLAAAAEFTKELTTSEATASEPEGQPQEAQPETSPPLSRPIPSRPPTPRSPLSPLTSSPPASSPSPSSLTPPTAPIPSAPTPPTRSADSARPASVDWPPEEDRRIIALRIVSVSPERFSGRAIRTALVAEGFVHGKYAIFHKADQRAVLSAASLSKPGVFDLDTIDSQRFSGLNLFAVLSASESAREPFEVLLACARNLNERLEGGLQDDRGGPLTPSRIAALRESLGAAPAALG